MSESLLFTQCIQNDFVKPIGRFDPIPNQLHVGFAEASRLMGEIPAEGPVARTMQWALSQPNEALQVIHIRDWHQASAPEQKAHLEMFGEHCLQNTEGAELAFETPTDAQSQALVVDSITLNDFSNTQLAQVLKPYEGKKCRVGIMGVWTEAKVSFLAYELATRYPDFDVAVCSALCASSSRQHHFEALDQLERILGVRVIDSVGAFIDFLGGESEALPLLGIRDNFPEIEVEGTDLSPTDRTLVRFLFRDCKKVSLKALDGGFSGNVAAATKSIDFHGHEQVPHVLKIGPADEMGKERTAFERIQDVMGNNAPQISDFADYGNRGAI
jgi:nicotinamidase-related amidase